jgi:signal transduction protein with GAF and PtsI domain
MTSRGATAQAELLQALCAVARELVDARAVSVALLDERAGELVFAAGAGEGADQVVGARFKATEGVAGEVLRTGEPRSVADLSREPQFAHDIAVASGYDPDAMSVVPVRRAGAVVGVLSALDPARDDVPALRLLADHAAAILDLAFTLQYGGRG